MDESFKVSVCIKVVLEQVTFIDLTPKLVNIDSATFIRELVQNMAQK